VELQIGGEVGKKFQEMQMESERKEAGKAG